MPILNRAAQLQDEVADWRHSLHAMPELDFDLHQTSAFVAAKLREFGCDEVATGIARTGVVGLIRGNGATQDGGSGATTIGLRADMDALALTEITGAPYASRTPGAMHACGHDGHTAMLLGAAQYLAETRNFSGTVAVIFQPAEEGGGGGRVMVQEGIMDRFNIERVYGMHNMPGLPLGQFAIRPGPIMAATAVFTIKIKGRGGHAAIPHNTIDPIVIGSQLVQALQAIVSRNADPIDSLVVSVTKFHGGDAYNVIPEEVEIAGTVRTLRSEVADLAQKRIEALCAGIGAAHGATISLDFRTGYPVTVNDGEQASFAGAVAAEVVGAKSVDLDVAPLMGGEDFSYMLQARPGAFIFIGNGNSAGLHNPAYDFDDRVIPYGISYWVRLVETALLQR
ncbi:M20 aminoacylase family protein [Tianweitania sediminis]|uniref:Amidohydrolase n=1 Tax=Tianweitania sediminis TaxID=1502156 RepID=A0A8J7UIQ0_9HYPH|nr:M20 aminoacylase family protein [Tianweitania sediminis]MBP0437879.1 amidohydrolase [Tianweitania sediminis]